MAKFTKGQKSVGRVYVKVEGNNVPENAQVGQWIKLRGQKKKARLVADGYLVTPTSNRPISNQAFRLGCKKPNRVVLTKGTTADSLKAINDLLSVYV